MFNYADKDGDGKISYTEFQIMINPPKPPEPPRPTLADLTKKTKMEDNKGSTKAKVKDTQPKTVATNTQPKTTPVSNIPEPRTLSVANILIHNANNKDVTLKVKKVVKDKGGKKISKP
jgi:hypothetical protein